VSYANTSRFSLVFVALISGALAACSAPSEDTGSSSSRSTADQSIVLNFTADFNQTASAPLVANENVTIAYDASRLSTCRGTEGANPAWSITAFYRFNGGTVSSLNVGGLNPNGGGAPNTTFALTSAGDLEMWFENNDVDGCNQYDSAYGKNYHFNVAASADAPGWVGDAQYVINRETCGANNAPCAQDFHPLDGGFTYDTYVRSQAAIRRAYFEVWKQGVTDFDNANLWKQLDVEVHSRVGGTGAFATAYVSFDERDGNNARYSVDLSTLDPVPGGPSGSALTDKSECPQFPVSYEGPTGAQYIDADLQFYFTVNGTELRPADGTVFHGDYQNYAGLYAICQ
jgi:Family of unknown function (DUF6209)